MAQQNKVDVFWTSHSDSKKVGTIESLATGEAQAAISTGLARRASDEDKKSVAAKKAASTRKDQATSDDTSTAADSKPAKK